MNHSGRPEPEDPVRPDDDTPQPPWWSEQADEDAPLPDGFPEPPEQEKVDELRDRLRRDVAAGGDHHRTPLHDRLERRGGGRTMRDLGSYTIIPMMMVVGPVIGWLMGRYAESRLGGEPWLGVAGVFLGLAAAVRQIILMLQRRAEQERERKGP